MGRPKKAVSIRQIAEEAEVSIATVSRVLNNRSDVSEESRDRVRRILEMRSFVLSPSGGRRRSIGVLMPNEHPNLSEYCSELLSGVADASFSKDVDATLIFQRVCAEPASALEKLREHGCHSAIVLLPHKIESQIGELAASGMPMVFMNWRNAPEGLSWVDSDAFGAGEALGLHLASLGHRSFAFIRNVLAPDHLERERGFLSGLAARGVPPESCLAVPLAPAKDPVDSAIAQTVEAFKARPGLSAVVAVNDSMAYGVLNACADAGLKVPEDVSVAGFDDYAMSKRFIPSLTTVRQPLFEMGRIAGEYVAEAMKPGFAAPPLRLVLPTELIVRKSTGPCGRASA